MRVRSAAYKARRALRHAKRRAAQVARYCLDHPAEAADIARLMPVDADHEVRARRRGDADCECDPALDGSGGRVAGAGLGHAQSQAEVDAAVWEAHEDFGRDDWKLEPFA